MHRGGSGFVQGIPETTLATFFPAEIAASNRSEILIGYILIKNNARPRYSFHRSVNWFTQ